MKKEVFSKINLYNKLPIIDISNDDFVKNVGNFLNKNGFSVAINAEKLWMLDKNFMDLTLFQNAFCFADGVASVFAAKLAKLDSSVEKINLPSEALKFSINNNLPVLIIGGQKESNERALKKIKERHIFPNEVSGIDGYKTDRELEEFILDWTINRPHTIILLGLGSPKQEKLAEKICSKNKKVFIVCCGGAINVLAGSVREAPSFISKSNYEWLYRTAMQPKKRIARLPRLLWILYKLLVLWIASFSKLYLKKLNR